MDHLILTSLAKDAAIDFWKTNKATLLKQLGASISVREVYYCAEAFNEGANAFNIHHKIKTSFVLNCISYLTENRD